MDLVDIDKALDDLELHDDDDDQFAGSRQLAAQRPEVPAQKAPSATAEMNSTIKATAAAAVNPAASAAAVVPIAAQATAVAASNSTNNKAASNSVSGVFASLNEYVNAAVDLGGGGSKLLAEAEAEAATAVAPAATATTAAATATKAAAATTAAAPVAMLAEQQPIEDTEQHLPIAASSMAAADSSETDDESDTDEDEAAAAAAAAAPPEPEVPPQPEQLQPVPIEADAKPVAGEPEAAAVAVAEPETVVIVNDELPAATASAAAPPPPPPPTPPPPATATDAADNSDNSASAASASATASASGLVVSFHDGATMDDVSDAELESYLQELELEQHKHQQPQQQQQQPQQQKPEQQKPERPATATAEDEASDVANNNNNSSQQPSDMSSAEKEAATELDETVDDDGDADRLLLQNVDSFSQASTVEYAEDDDGGATEEPEAEAEEKTVPQSTEISALDAEGGGGSSSSSSSESSESSLGDAIDEVVEEDVKADELPQTLAAAADQQLGERPSSLALSVNVAAPESALPIIAGQLPPPIAGAAPLIVETLGTDCTPSQPPPPPPQQQLLAAAAAEVAEIQPEEPESTAASQPLATEASASTEEAQQPPPLPPRPLQSILVATGGGLHSSSASSTRPIASQPLLGVVQPYWIPDSETQHCMLCAARFSLLRRRHHCRACGLVLCAACCGLRARLAYLGETEGRVCAPCAATLAEEAAAVAEFEAASAAAASAAEGGGGRRWPRSDPDGADEGGGGGVAEADDALLASAASSIGSPGHLNRPPNPNNPMEYCSLVSPLAAAAASGHGSAAPPIAVMVPVSVLKRSGSAPSGVGAAAAAAAAAGAATSPGTGSATSGSSAAATAPAADVSGAAAQPRRRPAKKSVMFSDGIRPGCDLADLDNNWSAPAAAASAASAAAASVDAPVAPQKMAASAAGSAVKKSSGAIPKVPSSSTTTSSSSAASNGLWPALDRLTRSYIPMAGVQLPPICRDPHPDGATVASQKAAKPSAATSRYEEVRNDATLVARLQKGETLRFAVQRNLFVLVRIVTLTCCVNKTVINYTTSGLHAVGRDELIVLLETDPATEPNLPKDIFHHFNAVYLAAAADGQRAGRPIGSNGSGDQAAGAGFCEDLAFSAAGFLDGGNRTLADLSGGYGDHPVAADRNGDAGQTAPFLGHREHGGFLYVRPTFQCLQSISVPANPFHIAVLVHRWEVPWARIFPLRLMLRLGALYRYYPCPHVSVRGRDSVYAEIAQTIINFLADFRTYTYTLAAVRGLRIHMEDRTMQVLVPRNRYDQVQRALANSSDHILALAGNFSPLADGHLVCIQNMEAGLSESHAYSTQAVNIQGRQRRVTGASFLVLNGALKTASGLSAKCSIVEDGLMVQIMPAKMAAVQKALREMRDVDIVCGPIDGGAEQTEVVNIRWVADDVDFNVGVTSPIDDRSMAGVRSIRVHRARDRSNGNHIIRWTEVFILQADEETQHNKDPVDMAKLSEQIAAAAATALVDFLDLLAASGLRKIGLRATLHSEDVSYEAGSQSQRLGPLYMNALDNELIQTLHGAATDLQPEQPILLELIFHILDE